MDEYVETIKKDKTYAGFIEINAISKIINRTIILLETFDYNGTNYYKKYTSFNQNNWDNIPIDKIILKLCE